MMHQCTLILFGCYDNCLKKTFEMIIILNLVTIGRESRYIHHLIEWFMKWKLRNIIDGIIYRYFHFTLWKSSRELDTKGCDIGEEIVCEQEQMHFSVWQLYKNTSVLHVKRGINLYINWFYWKDYYVWNKSW